MTRYLAGLATLLVLLAGCSTSDGEDSDTPADPDPDVASASEGAAEEPRRPKVGACYRLRHRDALSTTVGRSRVSCTRKHTSIVFHVGRLDLRHRGRELAVDAPRVRRQVQRTCATRLADHLGGDREALRLSMLTAVWFVPTAEEAERGARWFRCDVVAPGPRRSLLRLPGPDAVRGLLSDPERREAFATCGTAEPGSPRFRRVTCERPHSWRAVASVDLGDGRYPAPDRMAELMDGPCTDAAREVAEDPLDFGWSEERPSREQWRAGRRHGLCWAPAP